MRLEIPSDIDVGGYNGVIGLKLSMADYHYTGSDIHPFDDVQIASDMMMGEE